MAVISAGTRQPDRESYPFGSEFGPGHNSIYNDENGNLMIAYHGETGLTELLRCDMIRRVCFKEDGMTCVV